MADINIIPNNNPGMKPYEDRAGGGSGGSTGYSYNGSEIVTDKGVITVMIGNKNELQALAGKVGPGTIAYLAGWGNAWQLDLDGTTWVQMIGGT